MTRQRASPTPTPDTAPGPNAAAAAAVRVPPEAYDDPLVGQVLLGQFKVRHKLGEGGFGAVFLAEQEGVNRKAVIKLLHSRLASDKVFAERFHREAAVLAALDHHHIVRLYAFGAMPDGRLVLAMEFGGSKTLKEEIKHTGRLEMGRALRIAEQICEALSEAHGQSIVHRDLKPANILLGKKGADDWVKVVDLGIAKILDSGTLVPGGTLTGTGMVMGSPAYSSPEQAQGLPLDGRSDLYALGIVLYEMLTGSRPIQGSTTEEYWRGHIQDAPTPPTAYGVTLPPKVESILIRALAKDPDRRFQSAAEMAEALKDARLNPGKSKRKGRAIALAGAAVVVLVAGGLAIRAAISAPPPPAAVVPAPAPRAEPPPPPPAPVLSGGKLVIRAPGTEIKILGAVGPDIPLTGAKGSFAVAAADGSWKAALDYQRSDLESVQLTVQTEPAAVASGPEGPLGARPTIQLGALPVPLEFKGPGGLDFTLVFRYARE